MIKLLIYGMGEHYQKLKKLINWKNVQLEAFVDTWKSGYCFGGVEVISPYDVVLREYDYILCASIYEDEMRRTLKDLRIPEEKIVSGKLNYENMLDYNFLFDISNIQLYQNENIEKSVNILIERNRFCDIRQGISWLDGEISIIGDGAWAVGYEYLSVLCKVLNILKPKNILEMGLGQSSKVIMEYKKNCGCDYKIIEQDKEWYDFFTRDNGRIENDIKVLISPVKQVYNKKYDVKINCYSDINNIMADEKYEVISIDGPWGSEGISRVDILPYIPQCLKESWCILVDDYERDGEKNMIYELEMILKREDIQYCKRIYGKYGQLCLIASNDNKFLCSLF